MSGRRAAALPRSIEVTVVGRVRPGRSAAWLATWLAAAAPRRARGTVTVALVSDARMRALNTRFRAKPQPTDVLAFPEEGRGDVARVVRGKSKKQKELGSIAIALGVARRQAREWRHPIETEVRILALHGLLHLLGYDHERDTGEMRTLEDRLRRREGLPTGLIARASPTPTAR